MIINLVAETMVKLTVSTPKLNIKYQKHKNSGVETG